MRLVQHRLAILDTGKHTCCYGCHASAFYGSASYGRPLRLGDLVTTVLHHAGVQHTDFDWD